MTVHCKGCILTVHDQYNMKVGQDTCIEKQTHKTYGEYYIVNICIMEGLGKDVTSVYVLYMTGTTNVIFISISQFDEDA